MPHLEDPSLKPSTQKGLDRNRAWVLKNIIETIPYFVFWKDLNCNYLGCNEAFAHAAGLSTPDEIVGKNDVELPWKKEETEWFQTWDRRIMESGVAELNIEEPQLQADGRRRFISTSKVPLRDSGGGIVGVLGIFNDITERKILEEDLRLAKEAAEVSALAKTDFLSAMSHELRTPLTLILSPVEWLLREKRDELSASVAETLMCVQRNATRLMTLTDDILEFSRHEAGHLKLKTQPLDVNKHVKQLVLDFEPTATARGIVLRLDEVDVLGCAMLDVAKFDKILTNLIGNALKFTPSSGGEVTVSVRSCDGTMVIAVADNGIGIDVADHDRIFRRFEQIDGGSTRRYGGTGLGLSLVKVFADLMNGSVSVESALGQGATFTLRIPQSRADEDENDAAKHVIDFQRQALIPEGIGHDSLAAVAAPLPGAPHVVIAEDNRDLRKYLTGLLSGEFRVTALEDGQSAYDVIRKELPDVVVSDVMMPVMDGFELIAKLKSDPDLATIPVLLLTARAGTEMAADSIDRGADDYLAKPFSPLDLLARVRGAHRMRRLHRSLMEAERRAFESEQREALQKTRAELAHVSRIAALGELAASIAHEVNQPLMAIVTNAETCLEWLANDKLNPDEARRAAERIVRNGHRAGDIVKSIRALARKSQPEMVQFDVNEAIQDILVLVHGELRRHDVLLRTELFSSLQPIMGDRVQLQQVILNLIRNGIEAMQEIVDRPRVLQVGSAVDGAGNVTISVTDTGAGIDPTKIDCIFDAFFTTKSEGMGIGLSICRSIVEAHGGRLWAVANTDHGSAFHFVIPTAVKGIAVVKPN